MRRTKQIEQIWINKNFGKEIRLVAVKLGKKIKDVDSNDFKSDDDNKSWRLEL